MSCRTSFVCFNNYGGVSEWSERAKQIAKLWRKVPTEQRAPYLVCIDQSFGGVKYTAPVNDLGLLNMLVTT